MSVDVPFAADAAQADEAVPGQVPTTPGHEPSQPEPPANGLPPGHVAIVRRNGDAEDTSSWELGAAALFPWVLPSTQREPRDQRVTASTSDYTLHDDAPWQAVSRPTWRPRERGASIESMDVLAGEMGNLASGGPDYTADELAELQARRRAESDDADGEADPSEYERSMADLLSEDPSAWSTSYTQPPGEPG